MSLARGQMDVDIVCAGFGPATGGFLTTLGRALAREDGSVRLESRVAPGMPLQVMCFERADNFGVGVSGVVTRARGLRASFPDFEQAQIPLSTRVRSEKLVYLLDPIGASRRSRPLRAIDTLLRAAGRLTGARDHAVALPFIPSFIRKEDGFVLSIGQFGQWLSGQIMASGAAQIWPASPVDGPVFDGDRVAGVRLIDQGTDLSGAPTAAYTPGMDVRAALTVVGDGPVGAVGRALDARFGLPAGHVRDEWALGMKMVVDLRDGVDLEPGTVIHTFGFPEPEIFGFLYVLKPGTVSVGIFVPSWFHSPVRTAYRYLQHWMQHPYLWRWLEGGSLRSWGAKSLQEAGRRGEPHLAGDGYARIGEGSGSTNALTGSGVDEAWTTGVQLAEAVIELSERGEAFTRDNLERTYVRRRRASWLDRELRIAEGARDGFDRGVLWGMLGMALAANGVRPRFFGFRQRPVLSPPLTKTEKMGPDPVSGLDEQGWPPIVHDGRLLVTHQDALLMGGKVQAAPGYADHVRIKEPGLCRNCRARICVSMCSGQAITSAADEGIAFDREKCVHCGACVWNCASSNLEFRAGAGGLHSVEN